MKADVLLQIFSKEEFIKIFDENRLQKSPAFFDKKKLAWVNNQYMKQKDSEKVFELALPHLINAGLIPESNQSIYDPILNLLQKEIQELSQH